MGLTKDQQEIAKNAFAIYAGAKGSLTQNELSQCLGAMGFIPAKADLPSSDSFSYDDLVSQAGKFSVPEEDENGQLKEAFRVFDKANQGFLVAKEFLHMAQILGEPLDGAEKDAFAAHGNSGKISWKELSAEMVASSQKLGGDSAGGDSGAAAAAGGGDDDEGEGF